MWTPSIRNFFRRGQRLSVLAICAVALVVAACSNQTVSTVKPQILVRGQWVRPALPGLTTPVAAVAFAAADQHIGYACTAVTTAVTATPTTTAVTSTPPTTTTPTTASAGTPPTTTTPVATATAASQSTSTPVSTLQNAFWRTTDGGESWQAATLPTSLPNLLCPVSAIVAPDPSSPNDVLLLAASGNFDLSQPTSILPGQLQYQLWRSQDGAQTWTQLTLPTAPNPLTPVFIEPYHLLIVVNGQSIALGSNQSGADELFTSTDGGKAWTQHSNPTLAASGAAGTANVANTFAGFAAGPGAAIDALVTNATLAATTTPYQVWQSSDNGATWHALTAPTFTAAPGAGANAQIFTAPGGQIAYVVVQTNAANSATVTMRSTDGGTSWTALGWPVATTPTGTPPGAGIIATLGANFAVDAAGDAFIAPPVSDAALSQDPTAQNSAGFFTAAVDGSGWKLVAPPNVSNALAITLAVSLVNEPAPTGTPGATVTAGSTATPTVVATATNTAAPVAPGTKSTPTVMPSATAGMTPTAVPTGLPTLWTNFGPLTQLSQPANSVGLFQDVLP